MGFVTAEKRVRFPSPAPSNTNGYIKSRPKIWPAFMTLRDSLELNSLDPKQEASVILAYPNLQICPWTADELPHAANLPSP